MPYAILIATARGMFVQAGGGSCADATKAIHAIAPPILTGSIVWKTPEICNSFRRRVCVLDYAGRCHRGPYNLTGGLPLGRRRVTV
jgi:hypothetical protein